jgi:hypothetical protein
LVGLAPRGNCLPAIRGLASAGGFGARGALGAVVPVLRRSVDLVVPLVGGFGERAMAASFVLMEWVYTMLPAA